MFEVKGVLSWFEGVAPCRDKAVVDFCISCRKYTVCEIKTYVGQIENPIPDKASSFLK